MLLPGIGSEMEFNRGLNQAGGRRAHQIGSNLEFGLEARVD